MPLQESSRPEKSDIVRVGMIREHDRRKAADRGFSLIEVVMTISLIGIVILPLIEATFASVKASSTAREAAEIETVLQNAADRVNRALVGCDYTVYVQAASIANGWSGSQASATYQHYVPGTSLLASANPTNAWVTGACVGTVPTRDLLQLVTITVTSDSGHLSRSIQVVKSDV
jgi:prepilin-type N-terminal cleavage/methylation domain-containing protein